MSSYVLSREATQDLQDIFVYGQETWGETLASAYIHELFAVFGHIGQHPHIGRLRPELGEGLKSFPHGSHVVFFMNWQGELAVVRVLHGSRDHEALFADNDPFSSFD
ncbi:type II toxin-antitoxin system RelE/ParE family toxin [Hoeflea ulvae]|uniref:Toxin n=1 Tax=Hoeflea ulvae TaxID=2983764 RepID=A0ABT3YJE8_9HYPH|nr:type II toxin-antitoxin system RelE/ParE family toxin [Hoeflea ulvae]MCY0096025.1 type II toxin-antitoxin system RelE/ParE family toxin [Hoeflea ulvae]